MITLEPIIQFVDIFNIKSENKINDSNVFYLNSGKASISFLLAYFKYKKILKDKNSSVFIPKWVGSPVYQEIAAQAMPSSSTEISHEIYMMYHQYGFSQNFSKYLSSIKSDNPIIIEDCAHRIEGAVINKGESIKSYAIYSYNKFLPCLLLGGIQTSDDELMDWLRIRMKSASGSIALNLFKFLDEQLVHSKYFEKKDIFSTARKMAFSVYSSYPRPLSHSISMFESGVQKELDVRKIIYKYISGKAGPLGLLPDCWESTEAPYAIPIRAEIGKLLSIQEELKNYNIRAPIYHFDYNLNNLNPRYEKALMLPCHSRVTDRNVNLLTEILARTLS